MNGNTVNVVVRRPVNHVFHAVMTLCTGGLWLPVWILVWAVRRKL